MLLAALLCALPLDAQLPPASAAELGMGGRSVAITRGFAAVATNPAGLGMPRIEGLTLAVLPLRVPLEIFEDALGSSWEPVSLGDFAEWDGRKIPHPVREAWLERIERVGSQKGNGDLTGTLTALARGNFGFQLSTLTAVGLRLNPDASELLLFGNAGRTGEPRAFRLGGSSLDAWAVTTAAFAVGLPLDIRVGDSPIQSFAVGATVKATRGNGFYAARDLGSFLSGDPLEVWLRFPVIHTKLGGPVFNAGSGFGLDLGFQWEAEPWAAGLAMRNLLNTYHWDLERLFYRPATALFTQNDQESDFTPRPASQAPEDLLAAVRGFRFGPRLAAGLARSQSERLRLTFQLDVALGETAGPEPGFEGGVGAELQATPRVPLFAHASVLSGGARLGGGAGARFGRVLVTGAASFVTPGVDAASVAMLTVSLGGS